MKSRRTTKAARGAGARPRAGSQTDHPVSVPRSAGRGRRPGAAHARRGGLHVRIPRGPRLLGGGRLLAMVAALAVAAALVGGVAGPWLRVTSIETDGAHYTFPDRLAAVLNPLRGSSLLTVDVTALAARLTALPTVASARVETAFPDGLRIKLDEKVPVLIWQTLARRLLVAHDGAVIGDLPAGAVPAGLAALPLVDDRRPASWDLGPGDRIPADELATAQQLEAIDPAALGSTAAALAVRIDARCGYSISPLPSRTWLATFGLYGLASDGPQAIADQVVRQVAAVRTLFAAHPESTVAWVDARNPGRVYWRPTGQGDGTC